MATRTGASKTVLAVYLGFPERGRGHAEGPARLVARFTLVHYSRLPSTLSFGAFASGAAKIVRSQVHRGHSFDHM